jgi:Zn-dependent peptidase ImmA (M78 family)
MKKLLVTLPDHDDATFYIFHWSKPILEEAERRGVKVLKLEGEKANRKTFFDFLNSHNPSFLILNGHGDEKNSLWI